MQSKEKVAVITIEEVDGQVTISTVMSKESRVANETANTMFNMYVDLMNKVSGTVANIKRTEGKA